MTAIPDGPSPREAPVAAAENSARYGGWQFHGRLGRKIHPVVTNSYSGRIILYVILACLVISIVPEAPTWQKLAVVFVALCHPHLAYHIAIRSGDTRKFGFRTFVVDGVMMGAAIALMHYALVPTIAVLVGAFAASYLLGGLWLLSYGALPILIITTFLFPFVKVDFAAGSTGIPVALSALYISALLAVISILTNKVTRDLATIRRDLRANQEELETQAAVSASFAKVALLVNSTLDLDHVLEVITQSLSEVFNFNLTAILFYDKDGHTLNLHSMLGQVPAQTVERLRGLAIPLAEQDSAFVVTYLTRTPTYVPDLAGDKGAKKGVSAKAHRLVPVKSLLVYPLVIENEVIGVLSFSDTREQFHLEEKDIELIGRYVTFVATAIRNARMFQSVTEARQAAEGANRAKSQFLANMSHELRTPMNAVIGYSEMLEEEARDQGLDDMVPDLQRIRSAGRHLLKLINDVLDLSKIEADKVQLYPEQVMATDLVDEVAAAVKPLVEANQNLLKVEVEGELGELFVDVTKVKQVILNLLSNGAKFTERGTLTLHVSRRHERGLDWLVVDVTDTGIGMTEEQLGRLFQPFSQADASTTRKYGGSGLGLAISKHFAEMMGGSLRASSVIGHGSTFTFKLPVQAAVADRPSGVAVEHPTTTMEMDVLPDIGPDSPVVLVIDDDASVRDLMRRLLLREGYRVEAVADGETGILRARELYPMVITLDVMMPGMDGWTVLRHLKADPRLAKIPVIMQTIVDEPQKAYTLGAADHLIKPIDRMQMVEAVRRLRRSGNQGALLLAEDGKVLEQVAHVLGSEGWTVASVTDTARALELFNQRRPALVVVDLGMAQQDGFAFVDAVRGLPSGAETQIIVVMPEHLDAEGQKRLNGSVQRVVQGTAKGVEEVVSEIRRILHATVRTEPAR